MRSRWRALFDPAIRGCLRGTRYVALSIAIVGCGLADPQFDTLHPRQTSDCSHHIDGSSYGIGGRPLGENDVSAFVFRTGAAAPLIEVNYFIVNGDTVRLDSLLFTAVSASGETIAEAKPALLLNPLVRDEVAKLGEMPIELKGDGSTRGRDVYPSEHRTLYRVVVTFDNNLPEQFDLRSPDIWLNGKKYPVRVFGFRTFEGRGLGLCE